MKKRNILKLINGALASSLILSLVGCANYRALPLNTIVVAQSTKPYRADDVVIVAKAFDRRDCKKYLDRDVIQKGYRPVQLYIENKSERNYFFPLNCMSIPCARPEEVAEKVHTSTVARAAGYGAAALIFWPFVVPALVDGVKSAQANEALDSDFLSKTARDVVIAPHAHVNMLMFVPIESYQSVFNLTLVDLKTNRPRDFVIQVLN